MLLVRTFYILLSGSTKGCLRFVQILAFTLHSAKNLLLLRKMGSGRTVSEVVGDVCRKGYLSVDAGAPVQELRCCGIYTPASPYACFLRYLTP